MEQVIGDVAVYGIQQYEQSHSKESSAVNLNVTMSVSPQDNKSTVTNSCFMGDNVRGQTSVLQSGKPIQLDKLQKVEGKKTSHKRRKLDFKQKRKRTKRKHNQLYYSSSSSESETEDCSSSSSDDGRSNLRKCYRFQ